MRKLTTLVLLALTVTLGLAVISPAASGAPPQGGRQLVPLVRKLHRRWRPGLLEPGARQ